MQPSPSTIWGRDFTLLWTANFLMATSFYFLLPTVPGFAVDALGADKSQVGYLIGIYTVSALLIRPLAGYWLDARGRKSTYLVGLAAFAAIIFVYPASAGFLMLLAVRFLHGLSWGVLTTGGSTVAADLLPAQRRGEGLGYFGMTMTLAMAIGPMLAVQVTGGSQYSRLFLVAGSVAAFAGLMGLVIRYPQVPSVRRPFSLDSFLERRVAPVALISLFTMLSYGGVVSFITLFAQERGMNAGFFFMAYAVAMSIARPAAGRLLDRHGPAVIIGSGIASLVAGFMLLATSQTLVQMAAAAVLLGIGNGNMFPTLQAMSINLVGPQRRGVANSTLFSAQDLGIGIGSTVLGWVADAAGLSAMYAVSGLVLLIPLAYFFLYVRRYYAAEVGRAGGKA